MLHFDLKSAQLAILMEKAGQGDDAAFRQLYLTTCSALLQAAKRLVWSQETAEEVLQESFIVIWREAASFDSARARPMTWMKAIVRNKSVDWLRANSARDFCTLGGWDGEAQDGSFDSSLDPCASAERAQRRAQLDLGLTSLHALHREAIELCFFKELSHAEVASEMTLPLGTVKTWIRRGCQQMRHRIELA